MNILLCSFRYLLDVHLVMLVIVKHHKLNVVSPSLSLCYHYKWHFKQILVWKGLSKHFRFLRGSISRFGWMGSWQDHCEEFERLMKIVWYKTNGKLLFKPMSNTINYDWDIVIVCVMGYSWVQDVCVYIAVLYRCTYCCLSFPNLRY